MATKEEVELAVKAVKAGFLTKEQLGPAMARQDILAKQGQQVPLFKVLLESKAMTPQQYQLLVQDQGGPGTKTFPGDPIPGFKIGAKLGTGGMALVYRAVDAMDGAEVALKIMKPTHMANPRFVAQFHREAELLEKFDHRHLVKGFQHGRVNGLEYFAMEIVDGPSMREIVEKNGPVTEEQALRYTIQVAEAVEYTHKQGIVHRDIKPENILVTPEDDVKLIDLGFAKPIGSQEEPEGTTSGTPQYMSPEQAQGQASIDVRSDLYSLGATLYHMVLGDVPFKGGDNMEVMAAQVLQDLQTSETKSGKISRHMHFFLEKLMAKDKEIRYQTPREAIEDMRGQWEGMKSLQFNPDSVSRPTFGAGPASGGANPPSRRFGSKPPSPPARGGSGGTSDRLKRPTQGPTSRFGRPFKKD
ncbi:MAG: serine/threonine protein kinase [Candidatus Brocadiae bacterium]|nr:serine/threonine protein kinase [Candidatus Brocadiia bacterium]